MASNNPRRQDGFITILAVLIMTALISIAIGYLDLTSREGLLANRLKKADQARQAAIAGTRLAAGALIVDKINDGGTPYDGLDEAWFNLTNFTSGATAGTIDPYVLDVSQGIYFSVVVLDADGRAKINPAAANYTNALNLLGSMPYYQVGGGPTEANAQDIISNGYMSLTEATRTKWIGNERVSYITPWGSDYKINLNTVDPLDNFSNNDPIDILAGMAVRLGTMGNPVTTPGCGSTSQTGGSTAGAGYSYARALIRYRRGGAVANWANGTAAGPTAGPTGPVACGTAGPPGGPYGDPLDYPTCDWGPGPLRSTKSTGLTVAEFFRTAVGGGCTANKVRIAALATDYMKAYSDGYFIIQSKGWVLKDPNAADKVNSAKDAEYQILHVVLRTATGYDDCYHREWWQERRDMYGGGYTNGNYDWENTLYVYDKDYQ